jgi:soluble lytic murein transglycosylase-like protein
MSLESAVSRIDEIRTMLAPATKASATPATRVSGDSSPTASAAAASPPASFASTLSSVLDSTSDGSTTDPDDGSYDAEIDASSAQEGVDPALVRAIVAHESGFNANATSTAGAQGLMQLMPETAQGLGVTDSYDPAQNIAGGTHLIRTLLDRYDGNLGLALAAYNAGPGAVDRAGGIPPYGETQAYVRDVIANYQRTTSERTTG